jgi:hypothetical protein
VSETVTIGYQKIKVSQYVKEPQGLQGSPKGKQAGHMKTCCTLRLRDFLQIKRWKMENGNSCAGNMIEIKPTSTPATERIAPN